MCRVARPCEIFRLAIVSVVCVMFLGVRLAAAEVPIDPSLTDARQIILDFDRDTQKFFAAVRHQDRKIELYHSVDGGKTWVLEPGLLENELVDADMVVAGDYVYVAAALVGSSNADLIRYSAATGVVDQDYGRHTVLDVAPAAILDVALASDQDGADSEIYYAFITSDGVLRFFVDSSSDGTTFTTFAPGISDACCGLDMTFNPNSLDHDVFISYWDGYSTPAIHVWRSYPWVEVNYWGPETDQHTSAISAFGDQVIFCHTWRWPDGLSVWEQRSYGDHDTWVQSPLDIPLPGESWYSGCDVTARGGRGFASAYIHDSGDFDTIYFRRHTDPDTMAPWEARVPINEHDAAAGLGYSTSLTWFPPDHYALAYVGDPGNTPYFTLIEIPVFADGFESGATSAWSITVP